MRIIQRIWRNHEGIQYWEIIPQPEVDEQRLVENWREYYEIQSGILHTFFDEMDPMISRIMNGERGVVWDYVPLNGYEGLGDSTDQWPRRFLIYEVKQRDQR